MGELPQRAPRRFTLRQHLFRHLSAAVLSGGKGIVEIAPARIHGHHVPGKALGPRGLDQAEGVVFGAGRVDRGQQHGNDTRFRAKQHRL